METEIIDSELEALVDALSVEDEFYHVGIECLGYGMVDSTER